MKTLIKILRHLRYLHLNSEKPPRVEDFEKADVVITDMDRLIRDELKEFNFVEFMSSPHATCKSWCRVTISRPNGQLACVALRWFPETYSWQIPKPDGQFQTIGKCDIIDQIESLDGLCGHVENIRLVVPEFFNIG